MWAAILKSIFILMIIYWIVLLIPSKTMLEREHFGRVGAIFITQGLLCCAQCFEFLENYDVYFINIIFLIFCQHKKMVFNGLCECVLISSILVSLSDVSFLYLNFQNPIVVTIFFARLCLFLCLSPDKKINMFLNILSIPLSHYGIYPITFTDDQQEFILNTSFLELKRKIKVLEKFGIKKQVFHKLDFLGMLCYLVCDLLWNLHANRKNADLFICIFASSIRYQFYFIKSQLREYTSITDVCLYKLMFEFTQHKNDEITHKKIATHLISDISNIIIEYQQEVYEFNE